MDQIPTLSPKGAKLLDRAACCAQSVEDRSDAGISLALKRDGALEDRADRIAEDINHCRQTMQGVLRDPGLWLWMGDDDRTDLDDLTKEIAAFEERKEQLRFTPNAFCKLFCDTRSQARMASLLLRGTRGSLRHHRRTRTADHSCMQERPGPAHIRWMIRRDMPEVLAIDEESFDFPWLEEDYIRTLRARQCIGMVAERDDRIVGLMVYELLAHVIPILRLAVARDQRGRGIGSQMVQKLHNKLNAQRRRRLLLAQPESNIAGLTFAARRG
ncbi:MAG: GNAT family N-acetyltransferase, partial [Candidatus Peregrinibacteria bacterium]